MHAQTDLVAIKRILAGILLVLAAYAIYLAQDVVMPIVLGFLIALTLRPIVRTGETRGIPAVLTAALVVPLVAAIIGIGAYSLSGPVAELVASAPRIGRQLEVKFAEYRDEIEAVQQASKEVEKIANGGGDEAAQTVAVDRPPLLTMAASSLMGMLASVGIAFLLALFVLSTGTLFYERIIALLPLMSEKKRALRAMYDVERQVSRYLLTITVINIGLGITIAAALTLYGMENAILWGAIATALNFLPFIGALVGTAAIAATAIVGYPTLGEALVVPAIYLACTSIEGHFVTPMIVGRRLELNIVAVFLTVTVWGWLWGIAGVLMAVPILAATKVLCDHFESLRPLGQFLSARSPETVSTDTGDSGAQASQVSLTGSPRRAP